MFRKTDCESSRRLHLLVLSIVVAAANWSASAATFYVEPVLGNDSFTGLCNSFDGGNCGPKRTIRAAIDASSDGDVVLLGDGVYQSEGDRAVWFNGKRITVRSANGPANCVIDPQLTQRIFRLEDGETRETVIEGITFRRARAGFVPTPGGAIRLIAASPTIRNCVFLECEANPTGGAIHARDSEALIEDCTFTNCVGNTVFIRGGAVTMRDCRIVGAATSTAAALIVIDGTPDISGCTVENCTNDIDENGVVELVNVTVRDCTFLSNDGAVRLDGATLENCVVDNSLRAGAATAVFGINGTLRSTSVIGSFVGVTGSCAIFDCTIAGHTRAGVLNTGPVVDTVIEGCWYGVELTAAGAYEVIGCTISQSRESAVRATGQLTLAIRRSKIRDNGLDWPEFGSALSLHSGAQVLLDHSIVELNGGGNLVYARQGSALAVDHCLFHRNVATGRGGVFRVDGSASVTNTVFWRNTGAPGSRLAWVSATGTLSWAYCSRDPGPLDMHVVAGGALQTGPGVVEADPELLFGRLQLATNSPCRNAGDPSPPPPNTIDLDGETRVADGRRDIGPDEVLDLDSDGLTDHWELSWFDSIAECDPAVDSDLDSTTNALEHEEFRNPRAARRTVFVSNSGDDDWDGLAPTPQGSSVGPKRTIQAAVDACNATEADVVEVGPGVYTGTGNGNVNIRDRSVTVRSSIPTDPAVVAATVLLFEGNWPVDAFGFNMSSTSERAFRLDGVSIQGGSGFAHDVVRASNANVAVTRCLFAGTQGYTAIRATFAEIDASDCDFGTSTTPVIAHGGDVTIRRCARPGSLSLNRVRRVVVEDCSFRNGAGISATQPSEVRVYRSTFRNCSNAVRVDGVFGWTIPFEHGPIVELLDCSLTISNAVSLQSTPGSVRIDRCHALECGTIFADQTVKLVITNSLFEFTSGRSIGGEPLPWIDFRSGFDGTNGLTWLENCEFRNCGSMVLAAHARTTLVNCRFEQSYLYQHPLIDGPARLVSCEFVGSHGSGPILRNTGHVPMTLENCTIAESDLTTSLGAALQLGHQAQAMITNSIIWRTPSSQATPAMTVEAGAVLSIDRSIVEGGRSAVESLGEAFVGWSTTNRDEDPRFAEPRANDLRLRHDSPAIDAGAQLSVTLPALDVGGCPRVQDDDGDGAAEVNLGAREGRGLVVDDDAPADFASIQAAIDAIDPCSGSFVVVRPGLYQENLHTDGDALILSEAGPFETTVRGDGTQPVLRVTGGRLRFSGLTLRGGSSQRGGGVQLLDGASAELRSCIVTNCSAEDGAAIAVLGASAQLENSILHGNIASSGAAVLLDDAAAVTLLNCTVAQNSSPASVGGIRSIDSPLTVRNSIIYANTDADPTASISVSGTQPASVWYSCIETGWSGVGGALYITSADPRFVDANAADFRLRPSSPCIDVGTTDAFPRDFLFDIAGRPRIINDPAISNGWGGVDIGAHESRCIADFDENNIIDLIDLAVVLSNFGLSGTATHSMGDVDEDGDVNLVDLSQMLRSFGFVCE